MDENQDLHILQEAVDYELLAKRDLRTVCRLFAKLRRLVPSNKNIYCVVDSLSAYERKDEDGMTWRDDFDLVLGMLRAALEQTRRGIWARATALVLS
jgi:hypothetical protein